MSAGIIDLSELSTQFPTDEYDAGFWCALGRCIATFGMLEQTLRISILTLTATVPYTDDQVKDAYQKWYPMVEANKSQTLSPLIEKYRKEISNHPKARVQNLEFLLEDLETLAAYRNPLAHAAWPRLDGALAAVPHYIDRSGSVFSEVIDQKRLEDIQFRTGRMIAAIINTVTHMGYAFPGIPNCPGVDIFAMAPQKDDDAHGQT